MFGCCPIAAQWTIHFLADGRWGGGVSFYLLRRGWMEPRSFNLIASSRATVELDIRMQINWVRSLHSFAFCLDIFKIFSWLVVEWVLLWIAEEWNNCVQCPRSSRLIRNWLSQMNRYSFQQFANAHIKTAINRRMQSTETNSSAKYHRCGGFLGRRDRRLRKRNCVSIWVLPKILDTIKNC